MSQYQQQASRTGVFYTEDRSAIRWPYYANLIFWPLLLIVGIAATSTTGAGAWSWLMAIATCGTVLSIGFALRNWPVGIRIGADGISIGAVRRKANRPGKQPWSDYQRWQEMTAPWDAVRQAAVITGKTGLRDARLLGKRDLNRIGVLTAPFARAALLIEVDPSRVTIPDFRERDEQLPVWRLGHMTPFENSPVWYVPTRHPGALRAALAQHAGSFGGTPDPFLPAHLRLLFEQAGSAQP